MPSLGRYGQFCLSCDLCVLADDDKNQIITGALSVDMAIYCKSIDKSSQQWVGSSRSWCLSNKIDIGSDCRSSVFFWQ